MVLIYEGYEPGHGPKEAALLSYKTRKALGMGLHDGLPPQERVLAVLEKLTPEQIEELRELRTALLRVSDGHVREERPRYPALQNL